MTSSGCRRCPCRSCRKAVTSPLAPIPVLSVARVHWSVLTAWLLYCWLSSSAAPTHLPIPFPAPICPAITSPIFHDVVFAQVRRQRTVTEKWAACCLVWLPCTSPSRPNGHVVVTSRYYQSLLPSFVSNFILYWSSKIGTFTHYLNVNDNVYMDHFKI